MKRQRKPLQPSKILLVEGDEDARVIPELVEKNTDLQWETGKIPIVWIESVDGKPKLLEPASIETELKASGLTALGILIDADEDVAACWDSIRNRKELRDRYPPFPSVIPKEGFTTQAPDQPKFGVWIMPDNTNRGMLETFLLHLRPTSPLLEYANEVVEKAKQQDAPFSEAHQDKALIHTWLAWQDPPGRQMHNAIQEKMLTEPSPLLTD